MTSCSKQENLQLDEFSDYVFDTYVSDTARYPPSLLACQESTIRTTNACECFYSIFSRNFSSPRPNIFPFLEKLEDEQLRTSIKIRSATQERNVPTRRHREWGRARQTLISAFRNGELNQAEYVQTLAYKMLRSKI